MSLGIQLKPHPAEEKRQEVIAHLVHQGYSTPTPVETEESFQEEELPVVEFSPLSSTTGNLSHNTPATQPKEQVQERVVKPKVKRELVELKFPELKLVLSIHGLSIRDTNIAFRYNPNELQLEPAIEKELIISARGVDYKAIWLGGFIDFEETGDHILFFIRINSKTQ
jgi:hypothetical protein